MGGGEGGGGAKFFYFWKSRNKINSRPPLTGKNGEKTLLGKTARRICRGKRRKNVTYYSFWYLLLIYRIHILAHIWYGGEMSSRPRFPPFLPGLFFSGNVHILVEMFWRFPDPEPRTSCPSSATLASSQPEILDRGSLPRALLAFVLGFSPNIPPSLFFSK